MFRYYGGRGITYSERWDKFENFYEDMKTGYKKGLAIDRIDNNGGYSKENCRWATPTENARNRNKTHKFDYKGKSYTLKEIAELMGLNYSSVRKRFYSGWDITRLIETPTNENKSRNSRHS